jgi:hypothetical protein
LQPERAFVGGRGGQFRMGGSDARAGLDQLDLGVGGGFLALVDEEEVARSQLEAAALGLRQFPGKVALAQGRVDELGAVSTSMPMPATSARIFSPR